ncbi:SIR2 family protein [Mycobacterium sp. DBP42]|uniref:SIR2 family protein n=1 Tax=Mycobacterium sp. DBP42 TaxID=2545267 RepID=UPI00110CDA16|nr:SIR2 family protein [Mycobacterium sp. DBP42]TMS50908.1 fibronectin-binding protein (FBP) [Mycobacterium sp. DBP42]
MSEADKDPGGPPALQEQDHLALGERKWVPGDPLPARRYVEAFIAALLQSEHLNLLIGSGLTTGLAVASEVKVKADLGAKITTGDNELDEMLEAAAVISAQTSGRGYQPNVEDRLRVALQTHAGLLVVRDDRAALLRETIDNVLRAVRDSVVAIEAGLRQQSLTVSSEGARAVDLLTSFLGTFVGRVPTRDRLQIFTTNYDRVIEWGADRAGFRLLDRFIGSLEPVFRSSRLEIDYHYSPPGSYKEPRHLDGVFRLTKLHGSLDWRWNQPEHQVVRVPSMFGTASTVDANELLIYPNAAKDVETSLYPYADLFRDFSSAVCRPNATLVTYGYSFGDDHINRIIRDMLTIPSAHILIIAYSDDGERITRFAESYRRTGQVSLMIGPSFADIGRLTEEWLPWPGIAHLNGLQPIVGDTDDDADNRL